MKLMTRIAACMCLALICLLPTSAKTQSVLDPNDPVVTYDSTSPPAQPAWGQIGKWVRTVRINNWNTDAYKAYIYKGIAFRLKFPKTYDPAANDGKKYPMMIFFHGLGERGPITDNEYQLYIGGDFFNWSVNNGSYDGYILVIQSQGYFGPGQYQAIIEIAEYMMANNKLDPFRLTANGLSAGGQGTWDMLINYPHYITAATPMSYSSILYKDPAIIDKIKSRPIWISQGGLDGSPAPSTTEQVRDAILARGGNFRYTLYPSLGHGTWDQIWREPDFFPFQLRAYASNPWPLFGRTEFCPGDVINVNLALPEGYSEYQWKKGNTIIEGAQSNILNVTDTGTYYAKVRRGALWSEWSRIPVQIRIKPATISPDIQVSGMASRVLPSLDGSTTVKLEVPDGYVTYDWQKAGDATTISNTRFLTATPGQYRIRVTEQYGCSSEFSNVFTVVNANGPDKPDPASNVTASTLSPTSIRLDWSDHPTPAFNETGFEIYLATQSGGPYQLAAVAGQNVRKYVLTGLNPNTEYFFKIRSFNNNAAGAASNEAKAKTTVDAVAPTAPGNLQITGTTKSAISIKWNPSTDNVGVVQYEIFINGVRTYVTTDTSFVVSELAANNYYNLTVRAADFAGNHSSFSNQVTGQSILRGLNFKYYTFTGVWNNMQDFSTLSPVSTGVSPNVSLEPRTQEDTYSFLWEGFITIPVSGTYYFRTNSDDGSKVWLGPLNGTASPYSYSGTAIVDNDGLHGSQNATSSALTLAAGTYPIAIGYYEQSGDASVSVSWSTPETGANNFVVIPDVAFGDPALAGGSAPSKPSNLTATAVSHQRVNLSWNDNSNNETAFEVWRSTSPFSNFATIARVASPATGYVDSMVKPNTRYYYRVKAINQYGESDFDKVGQGVDYAYYEQSGLMALPDFNALSPVKTGRINNFRLGLQGRGDNFQVKYSGTITIPTTGIYTFFTSSDDGSRLYIDGFTQDHLIVDNDMTHGNQERSGSKNLTRGQHTIYVTYFESGGGEELAVKFSGPAIPKQAIPDSYLGVPFTNVTVLAPPTAPAYPDSLQAKGLSKTSIQLTWRDRSDNETGFEVYRSGVTNNDYYLFATLPANATSFTDEGLFANAVFYYKVVALNNDGHSGPSNEDSAKTVNTPPVIKDLQNRTVKYGQATSMNVSATDEDGEALSFSSPNLPSFVTITNNGNKTATLSFNPSVAENNNVYQDIAIIVTDTYGGKDTTTFTLTVNSNDDPVIDAIAAVNMNEADQLTIPLTATDANGDNITWTVEDLPGNFTLTPGANGSASLVLQPSFNAAGTYTVLVNAKDNNGGQSSRSFTLTVADKNPNKKIYARFMHSDAVGAPWNSITGPSFSNFNDEAGQSTSVGYNLVPSAWNVRQDGPTTGNNSGVYPDAVLKNYIYFGTWWTPATQNLVVNGLNPGGRYNITFHSGTSWPTGEPNGTTIFTSNGKSVFLNVQDNTKNTVSLNDLQPAGDGTITVTMSKTTGSFAGFVNAFVINQLYDDGTVPAAPANLIAVNVPGKGVQLTWQDNSYNEAEFQIYRSTSASGVFDLVGMAGTDVTSFLDGTGAGNSQYYYKVRASNSRGQSAYTTTVSIQTMNRVPGLNNISDVTMLNNETITINVFASDDASDQVRLTTSSLPSFITFTDHGGGAGEFHIQPNDGSVGIYQGLTVYATDNSDSVRSESFNLIVRDRDLSNQFYLDFSDGSGFPPSPWNNLAGWPFANTSWNNLKDETGNTSTLTVTLPDGFQGVRAGGVMARNGKELYPEIVTRTGEYEGTTAVRRVVIGGLNDSRKYNFVFFNSRDDGYNSTTNFTIGTQTVSLDASYNLNKTVQVNGVQPVNGEVTISVSKAVGADFAILSSIIVQEYIPATTSFLGPINLKVTGATTNSITLHWEDRSDNETAYEVLRALPGGSYSSLTSSLPANTTSYTDATATTDQNYFYVVRAKNATANSGYSNAVNGYTYKNQIYVNFTRDRLAPSPWNNTKTVPQDHLVWKNLKDISGSPSSINLVQTGHFAGLYDDGVNTGNNSGIFPDNVIIESYGLFPGQSATVKLTGLHLKMKYDLTFFASSNYIGDVNVGYTVNGRTSLLNASLNRNGTLTMYGIEPDENGEVLIGIAPGTPFSQFGLIGALIVNAYSNVPVTAPSVPSVTRQNFVTAVEATPTSTDVVAYPNPFGQSFTLSVPARSGEKAEVTVLNSEGRIIYRKQFGNLIEGMNTIRIQPGNDLPSGVYVVRISYGNRKGSQQIKLIRK